MVQEAKGLVIPRYFTKKGEDSYLSVSYEKRNSIIRNPDGSVVFEMRDVEVPAQWSQVATDILAQKYFRKAGVPLTNADGSVVYGPETSVRQVVHRLAGCWRFWGEKYGYFASSDDAQTFYDEVAYMLLHQVAAPNSPQWFNTGLAWAYGITGPAQGHSYVDPDTKQLTRSTDAYTRPQPHACADYFTQVYTDEGTYFIGDIVERNLIGLRVFDGERFVPLLATKHNGKKEVFRVTMKNGNFVDLTEDHLVWSAEKRRKDGGIYQWAEVKKLSPGAKIHQPSVFEIKEKNVFSEELAQARLAGWIVGDGSVGIYQAVMRLEIITINDDEHTAVLSDIKEVFGDDVSYWVTSFTTDDTRLTGRRIHLAGKKIHQFVQDYELLHKRSATATVPRRIIYGVPQEKREFLRALFQADGCVRIRVDENRNAGDICLTTSSPQLAFGVLQLLNSLGIYARISLNKDAREDREDTHQVIVAYGTAREAYEEEIGFVSEEKQQKLLLLNKLVQRSKSLPLIREETVVSIEPVGVRDVYDIQTVSGKFLANGIVVHNCFIQSVRDDLVNDGGIFDLLTREALIFKYGSGTGTNFSSLRAAGENLSGGGISSGMMSFLKVFDRAAGSIKSGGTTRRAAKMVCLDMDHPEIEEFIWWKVREEEKVAALVAGSAILRDKLSPVITLAQVNGDILRNKDLAKAVRAAAKDNIPLSYIVRAMDLARQHKTMPLNVYDTDYNNEAYLTVSGQNSNNSVRISNTFFDAVANDDMWALKARTGGKVMKLVPARKLWDDIGYCAWASADPGVQYDTVINEWHTCPSDGRINASNPCVTGDTLVLTENGAWRRIDNLIGSVTTVLANVGEIVPSTITGAFKTGRKPVYRLMTGCGYELKLTADHKVFTINRGFVQSCELTKDDHILLPRGTVADIKEPNDPTFYQMVGVYLGDGCGTSSHGIQLTMHREKERPVLEKFASYVGDNYERATHKDSPAVVTLRPTSSAYVVTNVQLKEKFAQLLDISLYAHEKYIPQEIFGAGLGVQKYVLQGLFTADGTVANYTEKSSYYISLDSTSLQLLKDVQIILLGFGIKSKLYTNRRAGKTTALLPDGHGGLKEYSVREMHSLRISRSSRILFQKFIGFMPESYKEKQLEEMNLATEVYTDQPIDVVKSLDYVGEEDVYDLTEPLTHTFVANGITIHNCSEYMFLDDTACNLASINLGQLYNDQTNEFDIPGYKHSVRLWTTILEISVLMAQFPSPSVALKSYEFRTLGLGYANLGSVLMRMGISYDSDLGRAIAGASTAILCGESYATSAELARALEPFPGYERNKQSMLRVIRNHRRAAYHTPDYEGLSVTPIALDQTVCPAALLQAAHEAWDKALSWGEQYGYRNAQVTVLAPTGTIGLVMDCDTTGVEPDYALVKFKKLAGGGYFKIVNQSVPLALRRLGYPDDQIKDIVAYCLGHGTLRGCLNITHERLAVKGFTPDVIAAIEKQLPSISELKYAFTQWILGKDFCMKLGFSEKQLGDPAFDLLKALGFTAQDIDAASEYICGTMTVEGAPHLKLEHYSVFDCANRCGKNGQRFIVPYGHLRMLSATQPFISGAISKTINMPRESSVDDIKDAYSFAWKHMVKAVALYRDGCKLSQALNTTFQENPELQKLLDSEELSFEEEVVVEQKIERAPVLEEPLVVEGNGQATGNGHVEYLSDVKAAGYIGGNEKCGGCGAKMVRRNGVCTICDVCGTTGGCS